MKISGNVPFVNWSIGILFSGTWCDSGHRSFYGARRACTLPPQRRTSRRFPEISDASNNLERHKLVFRCEFEIDPAKRR